MGRAHPLTCIELSGTMIGRALIRRLCFAISALRRRRLLEKLKVRPSPCRCRRPRLHARGSCNFQSSARYHPVVSRAERVRKDSSPSSSAAGQAEIFPSR